MPMAPGDTLCFTSLVIHGSAPNQSLQDRWANTIAYNVTGNGEGQDREILRGPVMAQAGQGPTAPQPEVAHLALHPPRLALSPVQDDPLRADFLAERRGMSVARRVRGLVQAAHGIVGQHQPFDLLAHQGGGLAAQEGTGPSMEVLISS